MQTKIQTMKAKLLHIVAFLFISIYSIEAQTDITFKTICKKQVSVGEQFQVSYELNGDGKAKSLCPTECLLKMPQ